MQDLTVEMANGCSKQIEMYMINKKYGNGTLICHYVNFEASIYAEDVIDIINSDTVLRI